MLLQGRQRSCRRERRAFELFLTDARNPAGVGVGANAICAGEEIGLCKAIDFEKFRSAALQVAFIAGLSTLICRPSLGKSLPRAEPAKHDVFPLTQEGRSRSLEKNASAPRCLGSGIVRDDTSEAAEPCQVLLPEQMSVIKRARREGSRRRSR